MFNFYFYFKVSWKGVVWVQVNNYTPTEIYLTVLGRGGFFMFYLTKLSVAPTTRCRMQERLVDTELERIWESAAVT